MATFWDDEDDSELDKLFSNGKPVLRDVLRCNDLIQQIRCDNDRIIDYFTDINVLVQCVEYSLKTEISDSNNISSYKSLQTSTEVIITPCRKIQDVIIANSSKLLGLIINYISSVTSPINDFKATYFCKILNVFIRDSHTMMTSDVIHHTLLNTLLKYVDNFCIMECIRNLFDIPITNNKYWFKDAKYVVDTLLTTLENSRDNSDIYYYHFSELLISLFSRSCHVLDDVTPLLGSLLLPEFISEESICRLINTSVITSFNIRQRAVSMALLARILQTKYPEDQYGYGPQGPSFNFPAMTIREKEVQGLLPAEYHKKVIPYIVQHLDVFIDRFRGRGFRGFNKIYLYHLSQMYYNLSLINPKLKQLKNPLLIRTIIEAMKSYYDCNFFLRSITEFLLVMINDYETAEIIISCPHFFTPLLPQYSAYYSSYFKIIYFLHEKYKDRLEHDNQWKKIISEDKMKYIDEIFQPNYNTKIIFDYSYPEYGLEVIPPPDDGKEHFSIKTESKVDLPPRATEQSFKISESDNNTNITNINNNTTANNNKADDHIFENNDNNDDEDDEFGSKSYESKLNNADTEGFGDDFGDDNNEGGFGDDNNDGGFGDDGNGGGFGNDGDDVGFGNDGDDGGFGNDGDDGWA